MYSIRYYISLNDAQRLIFRLNISYIRNSLELDGFQNKRVINCYSLS